MFDDVENCLDVMEILIDAEISPETPPGSAEEILLFAAASKPELFSGRVYND